MEPSANNEPKNAPNNERCVLAIDLGSGGPKVAVVTERGEILAHARGSVATLFVEGGGAEQDPQAWWRAVDHAVTAVLSAAAVDRNRIVAVTSTGQWSVTAPVDRDGQPLMNAVHWMDSRGAPYTQKLTDGLDQDRRLRAGAVAALDPDHGGRADARGGRFARAYSVSQARPPGRLRADAQSARADGLSQPAADRAVFGILRHDLSLHAHRQPRRQPRALSTTDCCSWRASIGKNFPDLVPVDAVLGPLLPEIAAAWQLPPTTQVVCGTADNQTAALGAGSIEDATRLHLGRYDLVAELPHPVQKDRPAAGHRHDAVGHSGSEHRRRRTGSCRPLPRSGGRTMLLSRTATMRSIASGASVYTKVFEKRRTCRPVARGCCFSPGSTARVRRRPTATSAADFSIKRCERGDPRPCGPCLRGWSSTWAGSCRTSRISSASGSSRCGWWAARPSRTCGARSSPTSSIGPFSGSPLPGWRRSAGRRCTRCMSLGIRRRDEISALVPIAGVFEPDPRNRKTYRELSSAFVDCYKRTRGLFRLLNRVANQ